MWVGRQLGLKYSKREEKNDSCWKGRQGCDINLLQANLNILERKKYG